MLFNSINFLIFYPIVTALYFIAPKNKAYIVLLIASFIFYASWDVKYLSLIVISILVTYFCSIIIDNSYKNDEVISIFKIKLSPKLTLNICLLINLGILFVFKYYNFFLENINIISGANFNFLRIALPVGISFYTFQAIGYTIDVYRKNINAERNILKYALFVSFFPQLVAGPIERSSNLLPQINSPRNINYNNIINGVLIMSWGFFLKLVIADRLAVVVNTVYSNHTMYSGSILLISTILFSFQVYCDFYSYSTIAVGSAKVLGINLMENFKAPYLSTSISAFWQRWHISLSGWFQDYIYTPLVWNNPFSKIPLIGKFFSKPPILTSIFIVFIISGLWHGASWTFIIWGFLHGFYRAVEIISKKSRKKLNKSLKINTDSAIHKSLLIVFTFFIVCISYIFFRSDSVLVAFEILTKIFFDFNASDLSLINTLGLNSRELYVALFCLVILFIHDYLYTKGVTLPKTGYKRYFLIYILVILTLVFGVYGVDYVAAPFIYFQF